MLNRSASLAMSTSVLKALPGKLDIKRHSPSILYKEGTDDFKNVEYEMIRLLLNVIYELSYVDKVDGIMNFFKPVKLMKNDFP